MNHRLSNVAAIGEIIASTAVVLSLIFVGWQISDANQETRAATQQAAMDSEMFMSATLANHAATWNKVTNSESLASGEEIRVGIVLYNMTMLESENRYQQFQSGFLSEQSWNGSLRSLRALVKFQIYNVWRDSPGGISHSQDFLELVDGLVEKSADN